MSISNFDQDMNIIAKLPDEPGGEGGLSAAKLKEEFDKGGNLIKTWINTVLIPHLISIGEGHDIEDGDANKLPVRPILRFLNSRLSVEDDAIVIDPNGKDGTDGADGESAYEAAQKGGYTGTEEEFRHELAAVGDKADVPPVVDITMDYTGWAEVDVGYKQTVTVTGGTAKTLVTLQPTPEQVAMLMNYGITALMVNNDGGTFYAYAIGGKPDVEMVFQAKLEEVAQG